MAQAEHDEAAVLADVLAYLRRRHDNARKAAEVMRGSDFGAELEALAQDRRRQLEVIIGEIEAGFHHGEAALAASLGAQHTGEI